MIIDYYIMPTGVKPFLEWFDNIPSLSNQQKVLNKIEFLRTGNFSNCVPVGSNVFERKMIGIRVCFLKYKNMRVLLLLGGEKDKQLL
jgi:putative addiction module killer protein